MRQQQETFIFTHLDRTKNLCKVTAHPSSAQICYRLVAENLKLLTIHRTSEMVKVVPEIELQCAMSKTNSEGAVQDSTLCWKGPSGNVERKFPISSAGETKAKHKK